MLHSKHPNTVPYMLFADEEGNIMEDIRYQVVGRSGEDIVPLAPEDFIELPSGSEIFFLPNRRPFGKNIETGTIELFEEGTSAIAVFVSPAHTQTYLSAYEVEEDADVLPLYAYTAIGWLDDKFYTTCVRIDPDKRQDYEQFSLPMVQKRVKQLKKKYPGNKLIDHLADNCALNYQCRAAQNYFLGRWECPVPSSPACNAECLGCISFQPDEHNINSSQFRLKFKPEAKEIVQISVDHLKEAPYPIISFGQGCEGEPLLVGDVLVEAVKEIRKQTPNGIININTNGSRPDVVEELCQVGLQSIRVSMNSAQEDWYKGYYLPRNYKFEDIKESIKVIRKHNGWASINYFVLPGYTDSVEEYEALRAFIKETDITMIQWRNFNIDPDWYRKKAKIKLSGNKIGVKNMMDKIKEEFPHLAYGYFNPAEHTQEEYFNKRKELNS